MTPTTANATMRPVLVLRERRRMVQWAIVALLLLGALGTVAVLRTAASVKSPQQGVAQALSQQDDLRALLSILRTWRARGDVPDASLAGSPDMGKLQTLLADVTWQAAEHPAGHALALRLQALLPVDAAPAPVPQTIAEAILVTEALLEFSRERIAVDLAALQTPDQSLQWIALAALAAAILLALIVLGLVAEFAAHHRRTSAALNRAQVRTDKAKADAEEAHAARTAFLAAARHELRTPLNAILGYQELLAEETSDPEALVYLVGIEQAGTELLAVVDDVLELSLAQPTGPVVTACSPAQIASDSLAAVESAAASKHLALSLVSEDSVPDRVGCDGRRLHRVLMILLGNAVKFTDAGRVTVRLDCRVSRVGGARLLISVADTGCGLPVERRARIFEPFYQIDNGFDREFGGAGLGLAVAKRLVDEMDGDISVSSELGRGTTFHVLVPVEQLDPAQTRCATERSAA